MKTANQLTFTTYEASLKLNPNDPTKIIFDNADNDYSPSFPWQSPPLGPWSGIGMAPELLCVYAVVNHLDNGRSAIKWERPHNGKYGLLRS